MHDDNGLRVLEFYWFIWITTLEAPCLDIDMLLVVCVIETPCILETPCLDIFLECGVLFNCFGANIVGMEATILIKNKGYL